MKLRQLFSVWLLLCAFSLSAKNSALLIGIGKYNTKNTGWSVIHGNNDVFLLQKKLSTMHFTIETLVDKNATKANIVSALNRLVATTVAGDIVYIHFSGHGQLIEDVNNDEQEDFDQSFVCYDACFSTKYKVGKYKYKGQNHLIDDEIFPLLNQLKQKVGSKGEVIVVFDTCYSGGADRNGKLESSDSDSEVEWINTTRGTDNEFKLNQTAKDFLRRIRKPGAYSAKGGRITIISACESDQRNYECRDRFSGKCYGSLSYCIAKMIDKHIDFSKWCDYFIDKKYKALKIFRPSQHPVIERH